MTTRRRALVGVGAGVVGLAIVGTVVWGATASAGRSDGRADAVPTGPVVMTEFPGLEPAAGEPQLERLSAAAPTVGTVGLASGPFDNRFALEELAFDGQTVTGHIEITSDVSEVIELEVLAGFYDAGNEFLGTAAYVHHAGQEHSHEGPPEEHYEFSVAVPAELAGRAVSAAVGVPVLVNE
jgi:hypothetical protein